MLGLGQTCLDAALEMNNGVLTRLYEDHGRLERFFDAIEDQCARLKSGKPADMARLKAIVVYLGDWAFPPHHALEDEIFVHVAKRMPRFRADIFDLPEDHNISQREFKKFSRAVESGDGSLAEVARAFVANERGHFISEEETVFWYAARLLSSSQWQTLQESLDRLEPRYAWPDDLDPIADLSI